MHGGSKRKVELPARTGGGKDVKKVRVALLGPGSSSDVKGLEAGLIELPKIVIHRNLEINLSESLVNSNDNMELEMANKAAPWVLPEPVPVLTENPRIEWVWVWGISDFFNWVWGWV